MVKNVVESLKFSGSSPFKMSASNERLFFSSVMLEREISTLFALVCVYRISEPIVGFSEVKPLSTLNMSNASCVLLSF